MLEIIELNRPKISAQPKPCVLKPSIKKSAITIIKVLIISKKSPKVRTLIGIEISTKIGFTKVFSKVKTTVKAMAATKFSIKMPGSNSATIIMAIVLKNNLFIAFMSVILNLNKDKKDLNIFHKKLKKDNFSYICEMKLTKNGILQ